MESSETRTKRPAKVSVRDIAYSAGMLDADGCISGQQQTTGIGYALDVMPCSNVDLGVIKWLQSVWGGNISYETTPKGRPFYRLRLRNEESRRYLKLVKQHLKLKRGQAECALAFLSLPNGTPHKKAKLVQKIQRLNQAGKIQSKLSSDIKRN